MKRFTVVLHIAFFWVATGMVYSEPSQHKYINRDYGYVFAVPRGWKVEQDPVPYIFNYPRSQAGPQGLLPEGGAAVRIIPMELFSTRSFGKDLESWVGWNTRTHSRDVQRENLQCIAGGIAQAHICVKVRSVFQLAPEDPPTTQVSYYFVLNGRYFRAFLEFHDGDRSAEKYIQALKFICESISLKT